MPLKQNRKLYSNYYEAAHHNKACLPYQISDILLAVLLKSGGTCNCKWKMSYLLYLCLLSTNLEGKKHPISEPGVTWFKFNFASFWERFCIQKNNDFKIWEMKRGLWLKHSQCLQNYLNTSYLYEKKRSRCPACQASEILHVLLAWQIHMNHSLLHFPLW